MVWHNIYCTMTFKEFLQLTEDGQGGGDKGLMGFGVPGEETFGNSTQRRAFVDKLKSTAGARPGQGGGMGAPGSGMPMGGPGMMMRKMMRKMKKK